jgi:hypothetical protein
MSRRRVAIAVAAGVLGLAVGGAVLAQERWFGFGGDQDAEMGGNTAYDGRFVFVRLRYGGGGLGSFGYRRFSYSGWAHDYPRADVHFMKILNEITLLRPRLDGSNILALDDPELGNFPVAYLSEPGGWHPTDSEAEGLSAYLRKGGFVIFDDFDGPRDWNNLEGQMRRVLPDARFFQLDGTHPIFHAFFEIDAPEKFVPPYGTAPPEFHGIFEDNDPTKRLMVIANHNNDVGEYWEFSDTGFMPVDLSNEAYKLGVNYVMYAMTH